MANNEMGENMKRKLQRGIAILSCLLMIISLVGGKLQYAFAMTNLSHVDEGVVFQVTNSVRENGQQLTTRVEHKEKLDDLKDGILYQLRNATEVVKSEKSEGDKFISNDVIYSQNSYQMVAAKNNYSGILVAENDVNVSGEVNQVSHGVIYTKSGNIIISGNSVELTGLFYAPNGTIKINCQNIKIRGKIICKDVQINAKSVEYVSDPMIDTKVCQLAEYQMKPYVHITMYYNDEEQKIGLEDIEAQAITLYTRYDSENFKERVGYKNGDLFELADDGGYFEAYVEIIDIYGEKKISNIETFQCESEGNCYEVCRDSDQDGLPDGYEIRDKLGKWNVEDSDGDGIKDGDEILIYGDATRKESNYLEKKILIKENTWNTMKRFCGEVLHENTSVEGTGYVSCSYLVKAGDGIEIYYNSEGEKVIVVDNIIQERQKIEFIDNSYMMLFCNAQGETVVKLAFDGVNQIYNEYTYGKHGVKTIQHNKMTYQYRYDKEGKIKDILINDKYLMRSEWISEHKCVKTLENGYQYILEYDDIGNLIKLSDDEGVLYKWNYDPNQHYQLMSVSDYINGQEYKYQYNAEGDMCEMTCDNGFSCEVVDEGINSTTVICYGDTIQKEEYRMNGDEYIYKNDAVKEIQGDTKSRLYYNNVQIYEKTVSMISDNEIQIKTENGTKKYIYDDQDLLSEVWLNDELINSYEYNGLNEMVRENSGEAGKTYLYAYDKGGNIQTVTSYTLDYEKESSKLTNGVEESTYDYDAAFTDQMISFQGKEITYDKTGNPLKYWNGYKFTWIQGQKLGSINTGVKNISYSYDMDGKRVQKIRDGQVTKYFYQNGNLVCESSQDGDIWYHYNAYGDLIYFEKGDEKFFYELDELKNVVGINNENGKTVVQYQYDAWGKVIKVSGDIKLGRQNPFRYRSYYYDEESGFYYLQNRYYDPCVKRMLNMDSYTDTGFGIFSHNVYAYCENTPVNTSNCSGNIPEWVKSLKKSPSGKNYFWKNTSNNYEINCYGYVAGVSNIVDPGYKSGYSFGWTVESVADAVVADYKKRGYDDCQIFSRTVAKGLSSRWKVIAVKIGTTTNKNRNYHDYHFMRRRFNEGEFWAHKPYKSGILIHKAGAFSTESWNGDAYDSNWMDTEYTYNSSTCFIAYTVC